ncbi:MAG: hypothetical protein AABZ30_08215 [Myxococcota bacterium]
MLLCAASGARADEALDQAKKRYGAGVEHFKAQRYAEAAKELEAAYALKPIPKFLVDIAKTHLKTGDRPAALRHLKQFLREARIGDPDRAAVEQMVAELEAEVVAPSEEAEIPAPIEVPGVEPEAPEEPAGNAKTGAGSAAAAKRKRAGPAAIVHTPIDEVRAGAKISLVAELPSGVDAAHVWVFYRDAGRERFRQREMAAQGYAYVAEIPARAVVSSSMQYYVEARDAAGRAVALSGSSYNPHIIVVIGGRAPPRRATAADAPPPEYRGWTWLSAAASVALVGAGATFAILAKDRESALEKAADDSLDQQAPAQPFTWDYRDIRDYEAQGRSFATLSRVFFAVGGLFAGAAGTLWYLDYRRAHEPRKQVLPMARLRLTPVGVLGEF